jgi:hypothetical protein
MLCDLGGRFALEFRVGFRRIVSAGDPHRASCFVARDRTARLLPQLQLHRRDRVGQFAQMPKKFILPALERGYGGSQCFQLVVDRHVFPLVGHKMPPGDPRLANGYAPASLEARTSGPPHQTFKAMSPIGHAIASHPQMGGRTSDHRARGRSIKARGDLFDVPDFLRRVTHARHRSSLPSCRRYRSCASSRISFALIPSAITVPQLSQISITLIT